MKPWLRWSLLALILLALILVPFAIWEEPLSDWSERALASTSQRLAIGALIVGLLTGDALLPIPSSFLAAGAVSLLGPWHGGLAVAFGISLSAWLGYGLGYWGGEPLALRIAGAAELARARRLMQRYGAWVLLLFRGVPVLAEASTILAGTTRLSGWTFGLVTGLGNAGLAAAYAATGALQLSGAAALLVPFACGVVLPAMGLLAARVLSQAS